MNFGVGPSGTGLPFPENLRRRASIITGFAGVIATIFSFRLTEMALPEIASLSSENARPLGTLTAYLSDGEYVVFDSTRRPISHAPRGHAASGARYQARARMTHDRDYVFTDRTQVNRQHIIEQHN